MKKLKDFAARYLYAAGSCLYLLTVGFLIGRNRHKLYSICDLFGYRHNVAGIAPTVGINGVVPESLLDGCTVSFRNPPSKEGGMVIHELLALNLITRAYSPKRIFEIGTFEGKTALNMATNSPDDTVIVTLDLPQQEENSAELPFDPGDKNYIRKDKSGHLFAGSEVEHKITQLFGDSATFDFSPYHNSMDMVFVDGAHSYEYVLNDSAVARGLLKDGKGIILWHDYAHWTGVTRALDELFVRDPFFNIVLLRGTSLACLVVK
ncbi:MAG: class I SAM-dependent methyltransferase [Armatimonadota bacterium]|nr:class I SAM-dependent methyltransferase [Armatimonadota bacterium]